MGDSWCQQGTALQLASSTAVPASLPDPPSRLSHPALNPAHTQTCRYAREECLRLLLAAGADVLTANDKGQTAAQVVRAEPRNPLNQNEGLLAVLEGTAELASIEQ